VIYRTETFGCPESSRWKRCRQARYFVDCIYKNEVPFNDGVSGLRVVQIVEAINQSWRKGEKWFIAIL
jgi:hypothetical protein